MRIVCVVGVSVDGEDDRAARPSPPREQAGGSSKLGAGGVSSSVSSAGRGDGCECV